ncbi:hypothetical protein [Cecembia rubra]|uniref:Outer membrane protein with beta-barrel domain n=1 Tax=Cecembia rubra TaxID=1485585 RepID=A0A2P8DXK2_9BACT|nr:hypothetical protein [Cecembia rubra]PSL01945.1 hypothetical protein CLV48_11134 [Cecembia rubra]
MKKLIFVIVLLIYCSTVTAQEQGDFRIQVAGDYKLQINDLGGNAGFEYLFADKFSFAPSFTYWFPDIGRSYSLNADLRYYLTEGISQVYLVGGYNNLWLNFQPGEPGQVLSRAGANFGVGAFLDLLDQFGVVTEFKMQSQNTRQPVLRVGMVFKLGSN